MNADRSPSAPEVSVVVPVYNEHASLARILQRVQASPENQEIIVIDDGSRDGTQEWLRGLVALRESGAAWAPVLGDGRLALENLRILFQGENRGKGAALRRAFREARGEIVIIQDADLEYDPRDYPVLLEPIRRGQADVVYGTRFAPGARPMRTWGQFLGNRIVTLFSNRLTGLALSDVWVGYKVFRREVLQALPLREDRFGFEIEVTARVARGGWRVTEVPISYRARSRAEGKKITWRDAVWGLWCVFRYNLGR